MWPCDPNPSNFLSIHTRTPLYLPPLLPNPPPSQLIPRTPSQRNSRINFISLFVYNTHYSFPSSFLQIFCRTDTLSPKKKMTMTKMFSKEKNYCHHQFHKDQTHHFVFNFLMDAPLPLTTYNFISFKTCNFYST